MHCVNYSICLSLFLSFHLSLPPSSCLPNHLPVIFFSKVTVSQCNCLSLCLYGFLNLSLSLCLSGFLNLSLFLSPFLSLSLSCSLLLSISLSLSPYLSIFPPLRLCFCHLPILSFSHLFLPPSLVEAIANFIVGGSKKVVSPYNRVLLNDNFSFWAVKHV